MSKTHDSLRFLELMAEQLRIAARKAREQDELRQLAEIERIHRSLKLHSGAVLATAAAEKQARLPGT